MTETIQRPPVGSRVQLDSADGPRCTVRYTGTEFYKPNYIGVEWDKPNGNHDGCVNNVRYFQTPPQCAAFIHRKRVLACRSMAEAVKDKYGKQEQQRDYRPDAPPADYKNTKENFKQIQSMNDQRYTFVGEEMAIRVFSSLHHLRVISVDRCQINKIDDNLPDMEHVEEVDISYNLISCWFEFAKVARLLPALHTLNISHNRLRCGLESDASCPTHSSEKIFENLRTLVALDIQHPILDTLIAMVKVGSFAKLCNLYAGFNSLTTIPLQINLMQNLEVLDLSHNDLQWDEVNHLSSLPLKRLLLSSCNISSVVYCGGFNQLEMLSLSDNHVSSLCCLDELGKFPTLKHLSMQHNRVVFDVSEMQKHPAHSMFNSKERKDSHDVVLNDEESRILLLNASYHIIARVRGLKTLNQSQISHTMRIDAEKFYLENAKSVRDRSLLYLFPRFAELAQDWNIQPSDSECFREPEANTLGRSLVSLHLIYVKNCVCHKTSAATGTADAESPIVNNTTKKLPRSLTISKLKLLVEKCLGIPKSANYKLTYKSSSFEEFGIILDGHDSQLGSFGVDDNGIIIASIRHDCTCIANLNI